MYNYEKFKRDCRLIFSELHAWHSWVESRKNFAIFIVNSKIAFVFETELLN